MLPVIKTNSIVSGVCPHLSFNFFVVVVVVNDVFQHKLAAQKYLSSNLACQTLDNNFNVDNVM